MEEKVEYWMEKYDRDVEQKQHELDVLKVCISYFMLVSKRSVRAGGSIITEGSATLYPLPPPIETQLGGGGGAPSLFRKARRNAKPLIWKWVFILIQIKLIFPKHSELGNGQLVAFLSAYMES